MNKEQESCLKETCTHTIAQCLIIHTRTNPDEWNQTHTKKTIMHIDTYILTILQV